MIKKTITQLEFGLKMQIKEQGEETCSQKTTMNCSSSLPQGMLLRHGSGPGSFPRQQSPACLRTDTSPALDYRGGYDTDGIRRCTLSRTAARWLVLGLRCMSRLNLMPKMFKTCCQLHVGLPSPASGLISGYPRGCLSLTMLEKSCSGEMM